MLEFRPPQPALSLRQRRFVDEYLIDLNASAAARRVGYSRSSCTSAGCRMLQKPHVRAAIEDAMAARSAATRITADNVLCELARIGFFDMRRLFDEDGRVKPVHALDAETAAGLATIEIEAVDAGPDTPARRMIKVRAWDKVRALMAMSRHLGLAAGKYAREPDEERKGPRGAILHGEADNTLSLAAKISTILEAARRRKAEMEANPDAAAPDGEA